ncbi:MAG: hypothetical protein IPK50_14555 [Fibrobacterota bacterium]|nr:hypothetical protein [Fibrobacterota bacterium]QQS03517.1 MAG: hypothetical protein IPK50_14555 [Fibrobacterota bacterium]
MTILLLSILSLWGAVGHSFREPQERSGCVLASARKVSSIPQAGEPVLTVDVLNLRLRTRRGKVDFQIASGPILDPVYDSLSNRIFWISMHEVCEIRVQSLQARSVYQERAFSGIGRINLSQGTLLIRGARADTCTKLDFRKMRPIPRRVGCPILDVP